MAKAAKKQGPSISETVREAIAESGLSAYALAQLGGVSRSVVSAFLSKERSLTLDTLDKLAPHLGLKLSYPSRKR